jgi:hypothetical protein
MATLNIISKLYVDESLLTEVETVFQTLDIYVLLTQLISG